MSLSMKSQSDATRQSAEAPAAATRLEQRHGFDTFM